MQRRHIFHQAAIVLILNTVTVACGGESIDVNELGLSLCDRLQNAYLARDWPKVDALVDPEYTGVAPGEVWDRARLKQEFPKIHMAKSHRESGKVLRLSSDLILVSEEVQLVETYNGENISGRYQMTTIWVSRGANWRLLFEQEIPIQTKPLNMQQGKARPYHTSEVVRQAF